MVFARRAVFSHRRMIAGAVLAGILAGCAAPPAPPPPSPPPHNVAPPAPPPAPAPAGFREESMVFYQPDAVFKTRLGVSRAAFNAYARHVERKLAATLDAAPPLPGFSAAIVIALKPSGVNHSWFVSGTKLPPGFAASLIAAAQSVPPVDVHGGPVAFAIVFDAYGGGGPPVVDAGHPIPIPREWRRQAAPSALSR